MKADLSSCTFHMKPSLIISNRNKCHFVLSLLDWMFYCEATLSICRCKQRHNMAKLYSFPSDICHVAVMGHNFTSAGRFDAKKNKSGNSELHSAGSLNRLKHLSAVCPWRRVKFLKMWFSLFNILTLYRYRFSNNPMYSLGQSKNANTKPWNLNFILKK